MAEQAQVMEKPKNSASLINVTTISVVILIVAMAVSGYLSYLKAAQVDAVCVAGGVFDCGTVLNSRYSEIADIPIAWLGFALNAVVLSLILLKPRIAFLRDYGTLIIFGLVLFAFIFSMWLIYVQAFLISAYCPWCLSHEALITLLFIVWTRETWKELAA